MFMEMFNKNSFFHLQHLHPLQSVNCDSNLRLVVDEDDNGKFRRERVNPLPADHDNSRL